MLIENLVPRLYPLLTFGIIVYNTVAHGYKNKTKMYASIRNKVEQTDKVIVHLKIQIAL